MCRGENDNEGHGGCYVTLFFVCVCVFGFFFLPSGSSLNDSLILVLQCKGMHACGEFLWLKAGMCMTFTALLSHD